MKRLFTTALFITVCAAGRAQVTAPLHVPIGFEPNVGQGQGDWSYCARGAGYRTEIGASGYHMYIRKSGAAQDLEFRFTGGNPRAPFIAEKRKGAVSNYFHGPSPAAWKTGVPNFESVLQRAVWPGVDVRYHGDGSRLEYDFIVAPGADPRAIRMSVKGAQSLQLDASGALQIATAAGAATQHAPAIYQLAAGKRRAVEGGFAVVAGNEVRFRVGAYDHSLPLVIDPTLYYSTFIGGSGSEQANAIVLDASGNIYVAGSTSSTTKGDNNVLVRKFTPNGALVFTADFGGGSDDFGNGIAVGADGSIYVAGQTASADFPLANATQANFSGSTTGFVSRLNPNGQGMVFSTFLSGGSADFASAIAVDSQGSAYVTGTSTSSDFPTTSGVVQPRNAGGKDAFITKFSATGTRVYSTLLGGGSDDQGLGIAVDTAGNAYVTGTTLSDSFPQVNNPFQHFRHGMVDAFVTELNSTGVNLVYSTFLGGGASDFGYAIAVDSSGSAYVAGKTASSDFPTTNGAYSTSYNGGDNDIFVAKLTSGQANVVYSTYIGSHGSDEGFALAVDSSGAVYITGDTDSDQYPLTSDAVQSTRKGNREVVVSKLDPTGSTLAYSTYLGGSQNDAGYGIALSAAQNIFVAGITSSSDFPVSGSAYQPQYGGNGNPDAFLSEIQFSVTAPPVVPTGSIVNGANFAPGPVAPGSIISIFGTGLAASATQAANIPLPTSLAGASVKVNGIAAPLFYVAPGQINAQIPYEAAAGAGSVVVTNAAGASQPASLTIAAAAPWIITANQRAVVMNQDGSLNSATNPAKVGSVVVVYFTGVGPVNAAVTTGAASPTAMSTSSSSASIGGVQAPVMYIGLSPGSVGLAQANLQVPSAGSGDVLMTLTVGGVQSSSATIAISQ